MFLESAIILAIVVLGGMGSLIGIAIAAVVMIGGTELLREMDFLKLIFGPDFTPELYRMLLFGLAMVFDDAVQTTRFRRQPRTHGLPLRNARPSQAALPRRVTADDLREEQTMA